MITETSPPTASLRSHLYGAILESRDADYDSAHRMSIKVWLVCAVAFNIASCAGRQSLTTDNAYPIRRAIVAEPTTFFLADCHFEPWDEALHLEPLHRELNRQFRLRGFRPLDYGPGLQPDLLVYCSVYAQTLKLARGVRVENGTLRVCTPKARPNQQFLRAGPMMIQVFDTRLRRIVWNGYADGLRDGEWAPDERLLPHAVQEILEGYHAVAPAVLAKAKE